jgi:hypothetical protein
LPIDFDKNWRVKMGGRGSGRRSNFDGKQETQDSMPLDIRKITRQALLMPGMGFSWQWLVNDRPVASISVAVHTNQCIVLSYRMKSSAEVVQQQVQTQTTSCNLGGQRTWFICPRCTKRVALLYAPGRYFACRQCSGLGYATQKESAGDRAATRADKLRKRLGWEAGILNGNGNKPKSMHWKTYLRLKGHHDALVQFCLRDFERKLGYLHNLPET